MKLFNFFLLIFAVALVLCGCRRVIAGPRDELVQFSWSYENENGSRYSLAFGDDGYANFSVRSDAEPLTLSGLCTVYDDHFVICDEGTTVLYTFCYTLYGDCVELTYDEGTLTLDKVKDT